MPASLRCQGVMASMQNLWPSCHSGHRTSIPACRLRPPLKLASGPPRRKEKQVQKAADAAAARKRKREREEAAALETADPLVREALQYVKRYAAGDKAAGEGAAGEGGLGEEDLLRAARDVAPPPAAAAGGGSGPAGAGGAAGVGQAPAIITLPADNSVWESKPAQETATAEEEMDAYFEGLFM